MVIKDFQNLKEVLDENIMALKETEQLDFKRQWYAHNELMLHDILCFANTIHNYDCFIIIGINDNRELIGINGDKNRKNQANVINYLTSVNFAGDNVPRIAVDTLILKDREVDVITIFNSFNVPFYLRKRKGGYDKIKEEFIYMRIEDQNSPIDRNSNYRAIETLWKKRFLLMMPAMTQIRKRLQNPIEWMENEVGYYNIYKPEFQLYIYYPDDDSIEGLRKGEFYVFSQTSPDYRYGRMEIKYYHIILDSINIVLLDGGRFKTTVPKWEFLDEKPGFPEPLYVYKYYLEDSIEYQMQRFLLNSSDSEEMIAKKKFDRVVLYFKNEKEHTRFNTYVLENKVLVEEILSEAQSSFNWLEDEDDLNIRACKKKLRTGLALNRVLEIFRLRN